jgi:hypothetical protein
MQRVLASQSLDGSNTPLYERLEPKDNAMRMINTRTQLPN